MFIDSMSRQPVYEQIVDQVEQMILSGLMRPGEQLPSVRSLSLELSINPNPIQKAYSELDGRGIIYTLPKPRPSCWPRRAAAAWVQSGSWPGNWRWPACLRMRCWPACAAPMSSPACKR